MALIGHLINSRIWFVCVLLLSQNIFSYDNLRWWGSPAFAIQTTTGELVIEDALIDSEKLKITVFPDYLDIESEVVLRDSMFDPSITDLEFISVLKLEPNSVVIGLLLWFDENTILKAKLKHATTAHEIYEDIVDRDPNQGRSRTRDPVLLQKWDKDEYHISIFPVTGGGKRKFRLRYLIPLKFKNGIHSSILPDPLSKSASIEVVAGDNINGFEIRNPYDSVLVQSDSKHSFTYSEAKLSNYFYLTTSPANNAKPHIYYSDFRIANFSGQMYHATVADSSTIKLFKSLNQEIVIFWRWNFPFFRDILLHSVIKNSNTLKSFLSKPEARFAKIAMVLSIQNDKKIVFDLDSAGGSDHTRMMAFIDSLAGLELPVIEPGPYPEFSEKEKLEIIERGAKEFEEALEEAISQYTNEQNTLKRMYFLVSGPSYLSSSDYVVEAAIDENINIIDGCIQCWPGVDLVEFRRFWNIDLKIGLKIKSNDVTRDFNQPYSRDNLFMANRFYSKEPFIDPENSIISMELIWNDKIFAEISEIPEFIHVTDSMSYARLHGGYQSLVAFSDSMPSSLGSALGFVDHKYALLALEGDLLRDSRYNEAGVPGLEYPEMYPENETVISYDVWDSTRWNPDLIIAKDSIPVWRPDGWGDVVASSKKLDKIVLLEDKLGIRFENKNLILDFSKLSQQQRLLLKVNIYHIDGTMVFNSEGINSPLPSIISLNNNIFVRAGIYIVEISVGSEKLVKRLPIF